jgi:hypothetical protein
MDANIQEPPRLVSDLIDQPTMYWNRSLLHEAFLPMDYEIIENIPLSTRRQTVFWAWHYDRKGVFSVRSAYKLLVQTRENQTAWLDGTASSSNIKEEEKSWTDLWKVKVPSKLKVFLWRLARQSLPTADVFNHRNMATHSTCVVCGERDSWRHSLVECHQARSVWALAPEDLRDYVINLQEPHARAWLASVFKDLTKEESTRVVVTLWALWYARRTIIHEGEYQSPLSTHCFVERFLNDLNILSSERTVNPPSKVVGPKWIAPPEGWSKINVDAAMSKNSGHGALAAVARSSDGAFLGASVVVVQGISDPEVLEPLACREGLDLASDLLLTKVRVASDCLNVIKSLESAG